MTAARKTRLVDCDPKWVESRGVTCAVMFACPEGHDDCKHVIPFREAIDGSDGATAWHGAVGGVTWGRSGDTFETLTLSPSIARRQRYPSKEAALADGVLEEYFSESLTCALHIFIVNCEIQFCGDSK